ncbi:MAG TPA: lantibiotic dehydratase, partial [Kofleriaceae bacterium]|nr:lantibiotic dehydratase [Kofleriaceae bacterium]
AQRAAIEACLVATPSPATKSALGRLRSRRVPPATGNAEVDATIEAYRSARAELAASRERTIEIEKSARVQAAEALQRIVRDPGFREALIWQNRSVLAGAVDRLLETAPEADDHKTRERQRLAARYAQRYLLKNDSIGFFGPIAWGVFDPTEPEFVATPSRSFLDRRAVSFEDWAISALAAQLSQDPDLRGIFTPRRRPSSWLDGNTLQMPPGAPRALTATEAWLVRHVDGNRSVRELVDTAVADPASAVAGAEDAMRELERLGRENVITWGIEVPCELDHPERWLRERLGQVADPVARARSIEPLDRLEEARARVARAAGKPEELLASVAALEDEFRAVTELSPKRAHGRTYVGRQTFYEDCRRAFDLRIGRAVLDVFAGPLTLILSSARWYSYESARRFRVAFDEAYDRALEDSPIRPLPLTTFLAAIRPVFSPDHHHTGPIVTIVQGELQRRWSDIVGLDRCDSATRSLVLRADDCRARVAELFSAPAPGWPRARYHSPDVLISAASAEQVARGNFLGVLGEIHTGVNTVMAHVAHRLHPERSAVDEAYEADMGMACISTVQGTIGRATNSPITPRDHHVEVGPTRSWRPRDHVHLAGDLYVERTGAGLRVRSRVRELDHDIISFMEPYLLSDTSPHFKLLPKRRHVPRVTIDKLVFSRERWSLDPATFRELTEPGTEAELMRRVNVWARTLGMPRYVFVTVPHEPKPFYVDLQPDLDR